MPQWLNRLLTTKSVIDIISIGKHFVDVIVDNSEPVDLDKFHNCILGLHITAFGRIYLDQLMTNIEGIIEKKMLCL
jgi:hypothetical protein